ncbi:MAG TPA: heparinase II/III family protein, partial [Candidatus Aminicenantes bacterium]|nr:heparinase II/III family protein [Candidatus Aminicenantes bacterium]
DNMLRNGALYCYEQSQEGGLNNGEADYLRGAMAAGICLGIPEYIQWAVDGPFGIHSLLENNVGRDGTYYETSMNYSDHARNLYVTFAEPLINCRREPYPEGLDLYRHPKFRALMSLLNLTFNCAGHRPSFGDTAPDISKIEVPPNPFDANDFMSLARLYSRSREDAEKKRLEPLLRRLAGDGMDELLENAPDPVWLLFHADAPAAAGDGTLSRELEARLTGSVFLGQKGIGVLRTGTGENAQALLLRFGPSLNHGHFDDLNFNYFAGGREITYDLGYDLASTHTQVGWAKQTVSHNLVAVDETSQGTESGGSLHLFADFPGLKLVEASSENSYRSRGVSLYRRLMAIVAAG